MELDLESSNCSDEEVESCEELLYRTDEKETPLENRRASSYDNQV